MKPLYMITLLSIIFSNTLKANPKASADTVIKLNSKTIFAAIETPPKYPGGERAFARYIENNLDYPEVAKLIGINGRVMVSFVIERDGHVSHVTPLKCIGAGCESEAARIISESKSWLPGSRDGKAVRVQYTVPINFNIKKEKVNMKELRKSAYGFVFQIKGVTYTIDEAEAILGKSFTSDSVSIAVLYDNDKYTMPDKKEVYLILIKD